MKRLLLGTAAVMALLVVGVEPASADKRHGHSHHRHNHNSHNHNSHNDRHHGHGNHHYSRSNTRYYGGYSPGGGVSFYFGSRPQRWHDTSHYDYHPGSYQRHGNHYDYVPGHYDYHQSGHWHR